MSLSKDQEIKMKAKLGKTLTMTIEKCAVETRPGGMKKMASDVA